MEELDELRMEFGRRRDNPGRAPDGYRHDEAAIWRAGYVWAMNEAANTVARRKWAKDA